MATTTTALPTLSADDAERLARETHSYLMHGRLPSRRHRARLGDGGAALRVPGALA